MITERATALPAVPRPRVECKKATISAGPCRLMWRSPAGGSEAQFGLRSSPFPWADSSDALGSGRSEGREAVQDRGPDLQLRHLPVKVAHHKALAKQFETPHPIAGKTLPRIVFWPGSFSGSADISTRLRRW